MTPIMSQYNTCRMASRCAVFLRECSVGILSCCVFLTHFSYYLLGEFHLTMRFTLRSIAALLLCFVNHVVFWRAKKQVIGSDTGGVIAVMADEQPIWDFPMEDNPQNASCKAVSALRLKHPISVSAFCACPQPAITGFVHFGPKSGNVFCGKIEEHIEPPFDVSCLRLLTAARGLRIPLNYTKNNSLSQ